MFRFFLIIILILLMLGGSIAGTIKVPGDYATIQAGIDAAANGDTVQVQPGKYLENLNFNGKCIVLGSLFMTTGLGSYIENTIIDGSGRGNAVRMVNGEDSTTVLCGFTITNGHAFCGAGIECYEANPTLLHVILTDNIVDYYYYHYDWMAGGVIHLENCRVTMENVLIKRNQNNPGGGTIHVSNSRLSMNHVTIVENSTGGMLFENDLGSFVTNSIVYANQAQSLIVHGAEPNITYSNIQGGWIGEGNIDINPFFCDQERGDFHLSDYSPCIGKGTIKVQSSIDLAGMQRPDPAGSTPDLGAYENHLSNPMNEPNITVDQDTLDFGNIFIGDSSCIQLRVRNTGSQDLLIHSIEASPQVFSVFPGFAGVDPLGLKVFSIFFNPLNEAQYNGTLILNSNDPDQSQLLITIIGRGIRPPKIQVVPDSLVVSLAEGTVTNQILTISNQGFSDLEYAVYPGRASSQYAIRFNGDDGYIRIPDSPSLDLSTGLTIEAWITTFSTDGPHAIVAKWNDNTNDHSYIFKNWDDNDRLSIELSKFYHNDLCAMQGTSSIPVNTWVNVATTFDGHVAKLYMDGEEQNTFAVQDTIRNSQTDLLIGAVHTWGGIFQNFYGMIDEVRIWNYARSAQEINDFIFKELVGSEPGLAAYWRFNEGTGDTAFDNSVNANNGNLHGNLNWIQSEAPLWKYGISCAPEKGVCQPNSTLQIVVSIDASNISPKKSNTTIMIISNDPSIKSVILCKKSL